VASNIQVVRITCDADYLRLVTYTTALREIARISAVAPWDRSEDEDDPAEIAEAVLRAMDDWEE
jgi:hypothetical protein